MIETLPNMRETPSEMDASGAPHGGVVEISNTHWSD